MVKIIRCDTAKAEQLDNVLQTGKEKYPGMTNVAIKLKLDKNVRFSCTER